MRVITNELEPPNSARGGIVSAGGSAGPSPRGAAGKAVMNLSVAGQKRNTSANDREKVTNALLYM
jgi:hypothetical protein